MAWSGVAKPELELEADWLAGVDWLAEAPFPSQLRLTLRPLRRAPLRILWGASSFIGLRPSSSSCWTPDLPEKMVEDSLDVNQEGSRITVAFTTAKPSKAFEKLSPTSVRLDASEPSLIIHLREADGGL